MLYIQKGEKETNNMKKVLQVMDGLGRGGVQTFVTNNISALYEKGIVCDFLIRRNNSVYDELIKSNEGKIILTASFPKHFISNYFQTIDYLKKHGHEYDAIHVHANALLYLLPIKCAYKIGIPIRIIHSHNTKTNVPWLKKLHIINRKKIMKWANRFVACGQDAGRWMFDTHKFEIINNCISEDEFCYSEENRKFIRNYYNISNDTVVIGHVGAFKAQKNHKFVLEIFKKYLNINQNAKLLLLGTGILEDEIKKMAKDLQIADKIIFAGARGEIYKYYHAMDVFLFPSLFEGLPFTLIEAQMSGLESLISDNITNECIVTDLVTKMNLEKTSDEWAEKMHMLIQQKKYREQYSDIVSNAGYGIKNSSDKLFKLYSGE